MAGGLKVTPDYDAKPADGWNIKLTFAFDWTAAYPAGVVHREFFGKDGAFRAMPKDAKFDAMYTQLTKTTDEKAQEGIVREIEAYVHDQANVLFLYSPATLFAVSNRVHFTPYDTFMLELAETGVNQERSDK